MPEAADNTKTKAGLELQTEQLREAIRFSLLAITGVSDKIAELKPVRETETPREKHSPNNLLDPNYSRPWWPVMAGLGGLYLGYRVLRNRLD